MKPAASPERWRRIEDIYRRALDLPVTERSAYLASECGGDAELQTEVEGLLASSDGEPTLIEDSLADAVRDFYASALLEPLDRIGQYQIVSLIGAGGMGRVYLAEDIRLQRKVALKTLAPGLARPDHVRRFEQEARAASALNHPNILTIHNVGNARGLRFIVSEYVEGKTLRELIKAAAIRGPGLEPAQALDIARQIATGLEAAHARGIVHRDIKPENVIVRPDGLVKILDFGIARLSEQTAPPAAATRLGAVVGTARYMSPEQTRGLPVDARTDVFSAAVVLYETLAGRTPFGGDTDGDVVVSILTADPPPLNTSSVPLQVQRVLRKALAKKPEERYANGGELRVALEEAGRSQPPRSRVPAAWVAAALLLAAASGLLIWQFSGSRAVQAPRTLAILPFHNLRPDSATDFLGFSLADEVITKLSYVGSLAVRPSSAVERYRERDVDPRAAGRDLKVETLLTGSFLRDGDNLRINAQLIDVKSDKIIWRDTVDVPYENLLAVQDRVAEEIISGLELRLSSSESQYVKAKPPVSRDAYEEYLRGVDLYAKGDYSGSIRVLEQCAKLAPDYAQAWAHLGRAYTTNASLQFGGRERYSQARAAYERALKLDPTLIEPRVYMANLFTDTGLVEQAVPLLRKALEESPNDAEAHWELGYAYRFAGVLDESLHEALKARTIDPSVKQTSSALNTWLYLGNYNEFLASLPNVNRVYILFYKGFGELYLNHRDQALDYFNRAYSQDPAVLQAQLGKAFAFAIQGQPDAGARLLRQTERRVNESGVADPEGFYKIAQAYAVLGAKREALHVLDHSIDGGFFCYPYIKSDPLLNNIRDEPRFGELLTQARQRHARFQAAFFSRETFVPEK